MKIDIKRLQKDLKFNLNDEEAKLVSKFILDHINHFESFQNFDTHNLDTLSFPYEKNMTFNDLREDIFLESNNNLITTNSNHIKDNYIIFGKDHIDNNRASNIEPIDNNSIIRKINLKSLKPKNNLLKGMTFGIKDNFAVKSEVTTSATLLLESFVTNYTATVVERLIDSGAHATMKTNLDELAMGGTGTFSPFGIVPNNNNEKHIIGGSSSGSSYVVAKGLVDFSLGSDTGDSVRKPAANAGIVGFKPTWGTVSRYGLFDYSPSLDHVGWFTRDVLTSAKIYDVVSGFDKLDETSIDVKVQDISKKLNTDIKKNKIGILPSNLIKFQNKEFEDKYIKTIKKLKENGNKVIEVSFDEKLLKILLPLYQVISYTEAASCNFNLQGINFGKRGVGNDVVANSRTEAFGLEVKKRFATGSFMLQNENQEKYFRKAKRIRRLILEEYNKMMKNIDLFIIPALLKEPALIEEINSFEQWSDENYIEELMLLGNFTGAPSMTVPNGKINEFNSSINIMGKLFEDLSVMNVSQFIMEVENE